MRWQADWLAGWQTGRQADEIQMRLKFSKLAVNQNI